VLVIGLELVVGDFMVLMVETGRLIGDLVVVMRCGGVIVSLVIG
jgi:hypothetical protein